MMRKRAALLGTLVAALALTAVPATAQDTTTTFEVTSSAGPLSISVPTAQTFSLARNGGQVDFDTPITVTDARDTLSRSWSVTVDGGTGFVNSEDGVTIQPGEVTYQPGTESIVSGVLSLDVVTTSNETLASANPVVSSSIDASLGLVDDVVEWTPALDVSPGNGLPDGTYNGTITHSVSG